MYHETFARCRCSKRTFRSLWRTFLNLLTDLLDIEVDPAEGCILVLLVLPVPAVTQVFQQRCLEVHHKFVSLMFSQRIPVKIHFPTM